MGRHHSDGFFKGVIVGSLVGGVIALLLAPKSGKETQAELKRRARSMKSDIDTTVAELQQDLGGKIDNLKSVAKELKGEALVESQELIRRAEVLKTDLQHSASGLAKTGAGAKDEAVDSAKRLVGEGSAVLSELERLTKKMVASAKDKASASGEKGNDVNDATTREEETEV